MIDFEYRNPTHIIFGRDTVPQIGPAAAALGKKALLVYGRQSMKKTGLYDRVVDALKKAGLEIVEHPGVKANPVLSHARAGAELAKREKVDVVVAVGGGSVIDEAKAIAAGALTDADIWDFFEFRVEIKDALPIVTLLTICGSGSEMNNGMVLTNEEKKAKFGLRAPCLYPRVSILDPTVTFTVPPDHTAYGAVDAFSHVFEVYMAREDLDTPIQKGIMETLMKTVVNRTPRALENPRDYNARADLMWASSLALCGITFSGAGPLALPCHMIEHSLSALYDMAHGEGLAIVMPGWMRYMADKKATPLEEFARGVFGVSTVEEGILALGGWLQRVNCPIRLSQRDIGKDQIPALAQNAYALARVWGLSEFYTPQVIEEILNLCL